MVGISAKFMRNETKSYFFIREQSDTWWKVWFSGLRLMFSNPSRTHSNPARSQLDRFQEVLNPARTLGRKTRFISKPTRIIPKRPHAFRMVTNWQKNWPRTFPFRNEWVRFALNAPRICFIHFQSQLTNKTCARPKSGHSQRYCGSECSQILACQKDLLFHFTTNLRDHISDRLRGI